MANLRTEMPTCAQFIDDLRLAFGAEAVNGWIRQGMADGTFYATEAGHAIGQRPEPPKNAVSLRDMVLDVPDAEPEPRRRGRFR